MRVTTHTRITILSHLISRLELLRRYHLGHVGTRRGARGMLGGTNILHRSQKKYRSGTPNFGMGLYSYATPTVYGVGGIFGKIVETNRRGSQPHCCYYIHIHVCIDMVKRYDCLTVRSHFCRLANRSK